MGAYFESKTDFLVNVLADEEAAKSWGWKLETVFNYDELKYLEDLFRKYGYEITMKNITYLCEIGSEMDLPFKKEG